MFVSINPFDANVTFAWLLVVPVQEVNVQQRCLWVLNEQELLSLLRGQTSPHSKQRHLIRYMHTAKRVLLAELQVHEKQSLLQNLLISPDQ